jgi:hypothetical protein
MTRLMLLRAVAVAAVMAASGVRGDLDALAGTGGGQQPQEPGQGQAAGQVEGPTQEAAQALASVQPTTLNPLLGSLLLPQWRDDKQPDLWVGQGQLFLKNQDAARALCNVTYTVRVEFDREHMMDGVRNLSLLGMYGADMHQDMLWLRAKFPRWMPRCVLGVLGVWVGHVARLGYGCSGRGCLGWR